MAPRPRPPFRSGPGKRSAARAFTLLEVLAALSILAVLAAILIPRVTDMGEDQAVVVESLKVRIRYAQMRSVNNVSVHGVTSSGSSYWMFSDGDTAKREVFPGETGNTVTLPTGITMSRFTVSFDNRGVPYSDAEASTGNALTTGSAAASITVGDQAGAVRITPQTGYVPD